ncbi:sulfonate ABC transporter substrate-binding protein [Candidatus Synechococcus spongiarum LMB bulk10E]|uniref:Sulfonate ABC transporter substrate-binding protein n=1 Tax=Candidatus Synechococcus spongiarum LMB bulk15M TaxID=1943582 RepID=A0A1T1D3G7_9SYNE|nr:sulfonate ABC transporter substrate-binding protein [Candidatus Synechococcus spongiarum LMB bulk15M]OOV35594.1 sulfonate ABC transporter substrate-binding protein [Candidatus Synechococcus spongiarum LMB bulk10E]
MTFTHSHVRNPDRAFSRLAILAVVSFLVAACSPRPPSATTSAPSGRSADPITIGYSSWAGWWPWAIAAEKELFTNNGVAVQMKWFDGYVESMETMASGQIDCNSQTLNDTISFLPGANGGQVVVLVNDNSTGNDQIIVDASITSIQDLKGKTVVIEEGVVDDFLLSLALQDNGMTRDDLVIKGLPTAQAAAAFVAGKADAVGAFPPFTGTAGKRDGAHVLVDSSSYPGAIPDLLVCNADLIAQHPEAVQAIVDTWWDVRAFMDTNPEEAEAIMATRAGISPDEYQQYKDGTTLFSLEDNLEAFSEGATMKSMPYATKVMADFMVKTGFIPEKPDMGNLFDDRFIKASAQ